MLKPTQKLVIVFAIALVLAVTGCTKTTEVEHHDVWQQIGENLLQNSSVKTQH